MNVLYLYDGEWPKGATRVRKETRALADGGHTVDLIARNVERAPVEDKESWMRVWRLPHFPGNRIRYALNFPFFLNPVWLYTLWKVIRRTKTDLILVCDLPLAPCAIWLGKLFGIPVHYDMGEIYPEFLRSLRMLEKQSPIKRFIRTPKFAEWVELYVLRRAAATYVVSEESLERAVALGVPRERLVIVGNTPESLTQLGTGDTPPEIRDLVEAKRDILLFVGIIIADRGVLDVIRAMPELLQLHPNAALVVVGDGPERPILEEEVAKLGLKERVRIVGWKVPDQLGGYYNSARIGLLPFRDSPHVRLTLANKLFDYMGAGIAVLASDLPPNRRVLEEAGSGELHRPDDVQDFARAAARMLSDGAKIEKMGKAGRHAAETLYSWSHDAERLRDGVARIR